MRTATVPLLNLAKTSPDSVLSAMGMLDDAGVCRLFDISIRTLERRVAEGLPVVKFGARRLFALESVREYLLSQELGRREPPRRAGRPKTRK